MMPSSVQRQPLSNALALQQPAVPLPVTTQFGVNTRGDAHGDSLTPAVRPGGNETARARELRNAVGPSRVRASCNASMALIGGIATAAGLTGIVLGHSPNSGTLQSGLLGLGYGLFVPGFTALALSPCGKFRRDANHNIPLETVVVNLGHELPLAPPLSNQAAATNPNNQNAIVIHPDGEYTLGRHEPSSAVATDANIQDATDINADTARTTPMHEDHIVIEMPEVDRAAQAFVSNQHASS